MLGPHEVEQLAGLVGIPNHGTCTQNRVVADLIHRMTKRNEQQVAECVENQSHVRATARETAVCCCLLCNLLLTDVLLAVVTTVPSISATVASS